LLKQIFPHVGMWGNITAPTQFGRLFSPALTLPFLLLPIPLILSQSRPVLRSVLIALNLYAYPHHIIFLGILECVTWLKGRRFPPYSFFAVGALASIPYAMQLWVVCSAGVYSDIYGRVGQTSDLSSMWFFMPFFGLTTLYLWRLGRLLNKDVIFSLACLVSVVVISVLDTFFKFPQVHLVGLRIFAFLAPLTIICVLKHFNFPKLKYLNAVLLAFILFGYAYPGWVHRNEYAEPMPPEIISELAALPDGAVVMTDSQREVIYISALTNQYPYLAYGIVSSANNDELIRRFVIVSRIFGWDDAKLHGGSWDGLASTHHWIFHHGAISGAASNEAIDKVVSTMTAFSPCQLLKIYEVNYIRFGVNPPPGLEACTVIRSTHILKVNH